jgi:phosphatidylglycerol:prolipoprotein diacylglycerol transferase
MLPYLGDLIFRHESGFAISPFGPLVAVGVLLGRSLLLKRAIKNGLPKSEVFFLINATLFFGFTLSHVFSVLFYDPSRIAREGWSTLFRFWDGISSFGGFIGGTVGVAVYCLRYKRPFLLVTDLCLEALALGWVFGRLGCTLLFDHPGQLSDAWFAFQHPLGPRHNLGFYEFLHTTFVLLPIAWWSNRRFLPGRVGICTALISLHYAPFRFWMDFYRASPAEGGDLRWWGSLTWAQYCCILLFFLGLYLVPKSLAKKRAGE